jgi:hypothetical protein
MTSLDIVNLITNNPITKLNANSRKNIYTFPYTIMFFAPERSGPKNI